MIIGNKKEVFVLNDDLHSNGKEIPVDDHLSSGEGVTR